MKVRRIVAAVATMSAATIGVAVPAYATMHHANSATEHFQLAIAGSHQVFIAHGPITGGGTDDASHDAYDVLHFGNGTLRLNHPDSQSHFNAKVNPKTCFAAFTITGKYTVDHGTGKYKGVTGHGTYKVSEQALLAKKKTGGCDENSEPKLFEGSINASGPISGK